MNETSDDSRARALWIADIRRQIYEGTYETPGRLAQAIDNFLRREAWQGSQDALDEEQPPTASSRGEKPN